MVGQTGENRVTDFHRHADKLAELLHSAVPFVVVTMVATRGSAPQIVGAKAIIGAGGLIDGTIGGGKVEAAAIRHAQAMLQDEACQHCQLVKWNLQTDIGMTCGGEVQFVFELANRPNWKVAVFGAGHVAQSLVPMLLQLQCAVTCIDSRPEWLARLPRHPRLRTIHTERLEDQVRQLDPRAFFVLMTQGHATDLPILVQILMNTPARFVGVIGSAQKAKILRRDLSNANVPDDRLQSFHCPVGLPLGNNTPPEISVSVVAQLIQERDRFGGR